MREVVEPGIDMLSQIYGLFVSWEMMSEQLDLDGIGDLSQFDLRYERRRDGRPCPGFWKLIHVNGQVMVVDIRR